jgi:lipoyl(octanoyl) transferase
MNGCGAHLAVEWLGRIRYADALALQEEAVEARRTRTSGDRLLLLEHPAVITLGRSARPGNLLASPDALAERGIEVFDVRRGGDVTYHAPGQLVGYLVTDLQQSARQAGGEPDVHRYLRRIEAALIDASQEMGVAARTLAGMTGVFAADCHGDESDSATPRKLASIGVGLRGWVSYHGFALNVTTDLRGFDSIVPCGLHRCR